ncbi:molecular chaperone [Providencia rettgeri]
MINRILMAIFFVFFITNAFSGTTLVGTRFLINNESKSLNIKIMNDENSDYLIKSELSDKRFIISPPLFLLPRNSNSIITILPTTVIDNISDELINLTVTSIPKSDLNSGENSISLAIRSHFKVIYRHRKIRESDYDKISLINFNKEFYLINKSKFIFTISVSKDKQYNNERIVNIVPEEKVKLNDICKGNTCHIWVNFYDESNDVIKSLDLSYSKN